jgi:hypothetical protein
MYMGCSVELSADTMKRTHSEGVRVWSSKAMTAGNFETDDGHKKPHSLHHVKANASI